MTDRSPSTTALNVAALRAAHMLIDGEPKILDDRVASRLFEPERLREMQAHPQRFMEPRMHSLRAHVVLRSRYAEDRLSEAVRRGIRQYVLLGAGFDTFAYRQPDWASGLRVFEVDHPASQETKRERLGSAGISIPSNVEYVPIDFESVSLDAGLRQGGLDPAIPTFFSCLGVIMYLSEDAAEAVFRLAASFPETSEIVFTFLAQDGSETGEDPASQASLASRAAAKGEPWLTRFDPEGLAARLRGIGFSEVALLTPDEADARYFSGRGDGLRAPSHTDIASAVV